MNSVKEKSNWIDGSYYPEQLVPDKITSLPEKVDFVIRLCAAWDFGLPLRPSTLNEILLEDWKVP